MRKVYLFDIGLLVVAGAVAGVLAEDAAHPAKRSEPAIAAEAFDRPEMIEHTEDGSAALDVTSPPSSDGDVQLIDAGDAEAPIGSYPQRASDDVDIAVGKALERGGKVVYEAAAEQGT